jgi:predicted secreted hydrolase
MKRSLLILGLIAAATTAFLLFRPSTAAVTTNAALESLLIDDGRSAGFARALTPGAIEFPRDLGPHDDFQTEWWYYTGNLEGADGRLFGYQFTIFRRALTPDAAPVDDASPWRSNQVYLAHFALSDIANGDFYAYERFSRGAAGLAGAQASPYRVWLEDWQVAEIGPGRTRIQAVADEVALDIVLTETLPPVLHGDRGLSVKGAEPGNASYYYSIVRQQVSGSVTVRGERVPVTGLSWKDHEYSTSALSPGAVGWDWFSLQLDNGTGLMFFQIRRDDGTLEPASSGSFILADGAVRHLERADWELEVLDTWTSAASGAVYPAGWRIAIPAIGLELRGAPLMANQELNLTTVYWEGAVEFRGTLNGAPVTARGYIEMTGYAGSMDGRL